MMPLWLDPTGRTTYGIGLCDRCHIKHSLDDLYDDPNTNGLKVCIYCRDDLDPYRLAPRRADDLTLRFHRPDTPLDSCGPIPVYANQILVPEPPVHALPDGNLSQVEI